MNTASGKHGFYIRSAWVSFFIGLIAVLAITIFRGVIFRISSFSELGSGYISLTAIEINGYCPTLFYRIMHNLTVVWSLIFYFSLMTLVLYLITKTSWQLKTIKLCYTILAIVHVVFYALFVLSVFLPVGDMITILKDN